MIDIVTIGAATVDIFIKSPSLLVKDKLLCLEYASKNEISQSLVCSGGGATNAAVSFSRLGLKSAPVSLLGNDPFSLYIFKDLQENLVSTDLLIHLDNELTDYSVIMVADDGGRSILTNRGSTHLSLSHIDWDKLVNTSWFYITSLEGDLDLLEQTIGFARENNIKIALNPGNREIKLRHRLIPLLKKIDFLLLNQSESETLTETKAKTPKFWTELLSYQSKIVAVTNGREGAYIITPEDKLFSPIINTKPIDETGAGDSFGSAFVAGLAHNLDNHQALHWGIRNSASVVSYLGAKKGLLTLNQMNHAPESR